jgi:hypothetical protein
VATLDEVIKAYLALRKQRDALVAKQKEEMAPLNQQMHQCQAWVQQQLLAQGQRNTRTENGSAFLQEDTNVVTEDWTSVLGWIRENSLWEFLEQRVSKSVVKDYIESTNAVPPGLKVTKELSCHIRK